MPNPQQIDANRKNSQLSTGPVTDEGKKRASLNATRHGFTGQTLILTADEQEAYQQHLRGYLAEYNPVTLPETDLLHQYADLRWTLHQISIQQQNLLTLMNAATRQLAGADDPLANASLTNDPLAAIAALAPLTKSLNTLSLYEQRRRRAADETQTRLRDMIFHRKQNDERTLAKASEFSALCKARKQPFLPADFGFVCSLQQVQAYEKGVIQENELADFQESLEED